MTWMDYVDKFGVNPFKNYSMVGKRITTEKERASIDAHMNSLNRTVGYLHDR